MRKTSKIGLNIEKLGGRKRGVTASSEGFSVVKKKKAQTRSLGGTRGRDLNTRERAELIPLQHIRERPTTKGNR